MDKDLNLFSIRDGRKVYRTVRGNEWKELFLPKLEQDLSKKDYKIFEAFVLERLDRKSFISFGDYKERLSNFLHKALIGPKQRAQKRIDDVFVSFDKVLSKEQAENFFKYEFSTLDFLQQAKAIQALKAKFPINLSYPLKAEDLYEKFNKFVKKDRRSWDISNVGFNISIDNFYKQMDDDFRNISPSDLWENFIESEIHKVRAEQEKLVNRLKKLSLEELADEIYYDLGDLKKEWERAKQFTNEWDRPTLKKFKQEKAEEYVYENVDIEQISDLWNIKSPFYAVLHILPSEKFDNFFKAISLSKSEIEDNLNLISFEGLDSFREMFPESKETETNRIDHYDDYYKRGLEYELIPSLNFLNNNFKVLGRKKSHSLGKITFKDLFKKFKALKTFSFGEFKFKRNQNYTLKEIIDVISQEQQLQNEMSMDKLGDMYARTDEGNLFPLSREEKRLVDDLYLDWIYDEDDDRLDKSFDEQIHILDNMVYPHEYSDIQFILYHWPIILKRA